MAMSEAVPDPGGMGARFFKLYQCCWGMRLNCPELLEPAL